MSETYCDQSQTVGGSVDDDKFRRNQARSLAAATFADTVRRFHGRDGVSERLIARSWCEALGAHGAVSVNGWYDPPPQGIAVLSGLSRISFETLRNEASWPGEHVIDWAAGALYGYCSPVNTSDGMPGDFAITLYFGSDPRIRAHFRTAYRAAWEVLAVASKESSSRALFLRSGEIFHAAGLRNCVVSHTDTTPLDLGHTFPVSREVGLNGARRLDAEARDAIRRSRKFLNNDSDWDLRANGRFTIEPQLVSTADPALPQVTFHYVIDPEAGRILDEPDMILAEFGLTH
jgi:hypothetical protein